MTDHDFNPLCRDQLFLLEKKLNALHKSFVKDYNMAIHLINNPNLNKNMDDVRVEISDMLDDQLNTCVIFYTETFAKIQRALLRYL